MKTWWYILDCSVKRTNPVDPFFWAPSKITRIAIMTTMIRNDNKKCWLSVTKRRKKADVIPEDWSRTIDLFVCFPPFTWRTKNAFTLSTISYTNYGNGKNPIEPYTRTKLFFFAQTYTRVFSQTFSSIMNTFSQLYTM